MSPAAEKRSEIDHEHTKELSEHIYRNMEELQMNLFLRKIRAYFILGIFLIIQISCSQIDQYHVWETVELTFQSEETYTNPYIDVEFWVMLNGPGFNKRIEGFWDGGNVYKVRVTATLPGEWSW